MFPKEIEMILARQLASSLATPVFLVDPAGTLIFYNEEAEGMLGRRFEESGEMALTEWLAIFEPTDQEGHPLRPETLPVSVALAEKRPSVCRCWVHGQDDERLELEVIAFPLMGQADRYLGVITLLWGVGRP